MTMSDDRVRLCLLDDNPSFTISETGLPTFAARTGLAGQDLFERNFELRWMWDLGQAKEFAARTRIAMIDDPTQLLSATRYPNILWFDYCMDQAVHKQRDLETLGSLETYYATLDPLKGDWGRNFEIFGFDDASFAKEVLWEELPGEDQHGGCIAGVDISSLLDHLAYVGVPQTMHHNLTATAVLEWQLSCHLGSLFERKSGTLRNWFVFFERALPALRDKLELGCRRGSLVPRISDILAVESALDIDTLSNRALSFHSSLGTERLRIEALFLDILYRWDATEDAPVRQDEATAQKAVLEWAGRLLDEASGRGRQSAVRDGLATAGKFIAAHADIFHYRRRRLSRELADAAENEIGRVIEQNAPLLDALGMPRDVIAKALRDGTVHELELSDEIAAAWGVLEPIKAEAPSPEAARYAALALLVWGEMAWKATVKGNVDSWFTEVEKLLSENTIVGGAVRERLEALSGLYVPEDLMRALSINESVEPTSDEVLRAFGRQAAIFASLQQHVDLIRPSTGARKGLEDSEEPTARVSQESEAKHHFLRYLFAPAPKKLLLWQEAATDVDKPLSRIGRPEGALKLRILAVLDEGTIEDGGLRPGELRLLRLFAREFGFSERHWPDWMKGKDNA